jgi:hypothetical protein
MRLLNTTTHSTDSATAKKGKISLEDFGFVRRILKTTTFGKGV